MHFIEQPLTFKSVLKHDCVAKKTLRVYEIDRFGLSQMLFFYKIDYPADKTVIIRLFF